METRFISKISIYCLSFSQFVVSFFPFFLFVLLSSISNPIQFQNGESLASRIENEVNTVYEEVKATAKEFNARGDLINGTNIAAFLRVANVMLAHGSV
jgi:hypothetical protein